MPVTDPSQAPTPRSQQMLFLIGHGLQSPLSALRWGCGRLGKMAKERMTQQELHVVESIQDQAKMLSSMLNALILVAKVEDGTHEMRTQDIYLHDFLNSFAPLREIFEGEPKIACPKGILLRVDRAVFETLFEAIAVILANAATGEKTLRIEVLQDTRECRISIEPEIELSFLRDMTVEDPSQQQMVGGAPGLMLSICTSLSGVLGGSIDVRKQENGYYTITLHLPAISQ